MFVFVCMPLRIDTGNMNQKYVNQKINELKIDVENLEKSMRKPGNNRPNPSNMQPKINQKSSKSQSKTIKNQAKVIAEASRNEFGYMVGSGTLPGSPLVKFLADFGRDLGPSRAQDG